MVDGNRLKFGYGDICVGSDGLTQRMSFQQFKPPAKCGDRVSEDIEYIGDKIILEFFMKIIVSLVNNLNEF